MSIYTVHAPPPKGDDTSTDPERFVFVRDGFYFWAFLFGPLWLLRYRLWLVLLGYVLVVAALYAGLHVIGASSMVRSGVMFLVALLLGFEAGTLRRFTLTRRGWRNLGIVVADDQDAAERRFYDAWIRPGGEVPVAPAPLPAAPTWRPPTSSPVIGLFPEPGASR